VKQVVGALLVVFAASPCVAQVYVGRPAPRAGSVEVSGGLLAAGGKDLPDVSATLTRNPGTGSGPFELFRSDATLTAALGGQARVGYYFSPKIALEGGVQYVRPKVEVRLTDDSELAEDTTASETVTSYLFTGSVLYHFGGNSSRFRPFLAGGGGHVRDVHDGNGVVDTGMEFHGGAGFKSWFGSGRSKMGIRADITASVRGGGVGAEESRRIVPTASFSLAYVF
jgi:hypothetical protein